MACDYAINPILAEAGLTLPKGILLDRRFWGMSAERIYNLLGNEEDENNSNSGRDEQQQDTQQIHDDAGMPGSNREDDGEPEAPETPGPSDKCSMLRSQRATERHRLKHRRESGRSP